MIREKMLLLLAAGVAALAACSNTAAPNTAADEAAVRTVNAGWFKAYNAGDAAAVTANYADDAVLAAPGAPGAHGKAAIGAMFAKDVPALGAAGLSNSDGPSDIGVSGDVAWQSGTYTVNDKSGATVEAGKYLTVFQRKDGKWMIIRDTWNSDAPPAAPPAAAAAPPASATSAPHK
jgi:uncharacterized protein (TIGR02246 family)